jgi:hypothetical protein
MRRVRGVCSKLRYVERKTLNTNHLFSGLIGFVFAHDPMNGIAVKSSMLPIVTNTRTKFGNEHRQIALPRQVESVLFICATSSDEVKPNLIDVFACYRPQVIVVCTIGKAIDLVVLQRFCTSVRSRHVLASSC